MTEGRPVNAFPLRNPACRKARRHLTASRLSGRIRSGRCRWPRNHWWERDFAIATRFCHGKHHYFANFSKLDAGRSAYDPLSFSLGASDQKLASSAPASPVSESDRDRSGSCLAETEFHEPLPPGKRSIQIVLHFRLARRGHAVPAPELQTGGSDPMVRLKKKLSSMGRK